MYFCKCKQGADFGFDGVQGQHVSMPEQVTVSVIMVTKN